MSTKRIKDFNFKEDMLSVWKKGEWETVISGIERMIDNEVRKGREEGFRQGKQEGREEGRQEGIEEGRKGLKRAIVSRLMEMGLDPEMIRKATELSDEQINEACEEYRISAD